VEGDVFFAGTFKTIGNAVLAVQALPMLYQARYREQEAGRIKNEIESLISQIERSDTAAPAPVAARPSPKLSTEDRLLREVIPNLLYHRRDPAEFKRTADEFRAAMKKYRFREDIDAIIALIAGPPEPADKENRLLELYARKIASVEKEDFSAVDTITREIARLRGR
jgi:hypothetical protein